MKRVIMFWLLLLKNNQVSKSIKNHFMQFKSVVYKEIYISYKKSTKILTF